MTLMLASVADAAEAEIALIEGADIIDLKDPAQPPLGALDPSVVRAVVTAIGGRRPVSAVTGNLAMQPDVVVAAAKAVAETGVDYVKVGIFPSEATLACIDALRPLAGNINLIAVLFADLGADAAFPSQLANDGFKGVMLDTAAKGKKRLIDYIPIARLKDFVDDCQESRLMSGLAGSLEPPDIPRLLPLDPTVIGFRGTLCGNHDRAGRIDAARVKLVRDLIPHQQEARDFGEEVKVDWRLLSARGYSVDTAERKETDRVFIRDLILPVSIGAYDFERGHTQRVRFNVDVDARRGMHQAEDVRDIFSYDLIIDAIRLIVSHGHVDLVETLAERVADTLLAHPHVIGVKVRVEKLDVIEGSVGIEISRERRAQSGKLHQLFATLSDGPVSKTGG